MADGTEAELRQAPFACRDSAMQASSEEHLAGLPAAVSQCGRRFHYAAAGFGPVQNFSVPRAIRFPDFRSKSMTFALSNRTFTFVPMVKISLPNTTPVRR